MNTQQPVVPWKAEPLNNTYSKHPERNMTTIRKHKALSFFNRFYNKTIDPMTAMRISQSLNVTHRHNSCDISD